ncbi:MAG: ribokinase [Alphaproteobacteria bacterium]
MIIVFGSLNMDMVMPVETMPRLGETVLCPEYRIIPGGKGANQAVAAAKAGGDVKLFGKVGNDLFGKTILEALEKHAIDIQGVEVIDEPTGCACVSVDKNGENMILVASGANRKALETDIPDHLLTPETTVIIQMETPAEEIWLLIQRAHKAGARTVLNLAPAHLIPVNVLKNLSVLVMNQIEASMLAVHLGFDVISPTIAARRISSEYNLTCVVTLGGEGAIACTPKGVWTTEAMDIKPIDTTAAGDAFVGVFAAAIDRDESIPVALRWATVASGLACLNYGAQSSLPTMEEIKNSLPRVMSPQRKT